jgi:ligand-binding sensor domain-containing protein
MILILNKPIQIRTFLMLVLLMFQASASSQVKVSEWRSHFSYNRIHDLTESGERVFAASRNGILIYNKNYSNTETLDIIKDLNDVNISALGYNQNRNILFVGYTNGNLDIVEGKDITNIPVIKDESIYGEKTIHDIKFYGDQAYLCTSFGIVTLNMETKDIDETYLVDDISTVGVRDIAKAEGYFYVATDQGLFYASENDPDLGNPDAWEQVVSLPNYMQPVSNVETFQNNIVLSQSHSGSPDRVYYFDNLGSYTLLLDSETKIMDIRKNQDKLTVASNEQVLIYNSIFSLTDQIQQYAGESASPLSVLPSGNGYWIGDRISGLIHFISETNNESIIWPGPSSSHAFSMIGEEGIISVTAGGYNQYFNELQRPFQVFQFQEETWANFSFDGLEDATDIIPSDLDKQYFAGTWGDGILKFSGEEIIDHYTESNSALELASSGGVKIKDLELDGSENLWVINDETTDPLKCMDADGNWYVLDHSDLRNRRIGNLTVDNNGTVWGYFNNSRYVFALDYNQTPGNTDDDQLVVKEPKDENGKAFLGKIYGINKDRDGTIWFISDEGILADYEPSEIFSVNSYRPSRIMITVDGISQYLMSEKEVTSMATDPGNRKWFGTERAGVFVFSEDGEEVIHNFSTANTPLISDSISAIAIDKLSGEVFVGCSGGIVSYRGEAAKSYDNFKNAYVFPNPVRPDYEGLITIKGLVYGVNVKITDINGNLVHETVAQGGQAIWDGKNLAGNKVHTGVYLIFLTNEDGTKTHIEKLLFVK